MSIAPCDDDDLKFHNIRTGERIRHYEIIRLLGKGTQGSVVSAVDTRNGSIAALKVNRSTPAGWRSVADEIWTLRNLKKKSSKFSGYVRVPRETFTFGPHACLVFDLLGNSLAMFLKENHLRPFPPGQLQTISWQLFAGVTFLHENGIIHADLKPDNILLVQDEYEQIVVTGNQDQEGRNLPYGSTFADDSDEPWRILKNTTIRITDFGLAVTSLREVHYHQIQALDYRAPEVSLGLTWSFSADIYSLGCILSECRFGTLMFASTSDFERLCALHGFIGPMPKSLANEGAKVHREYFMMQDGKLQLAWNAIYDESTLQYFKDRRKLYDNLLGVSKIDEELGKLLILLLDYDPVKRISARDALRSDYFSAYLMPLAKDLMRS